MSKPLVIGLTAWLVLVACGPAPTAVNQTERAKAEAAVDHHTSQNALDWAGVYQGVLPCADCEGIETVLTLNRNNTYQLSTTYLGKSLTASHQQGNFVWSAAGTVIQLLDQKDGPTQYKVGENHVTQLDLSGQMITGNLAANYKLSKQGSTTDLQLTGVRWRLTELQGQPVPPTEPDMTPYIEFSNDSRVTGFAGCNQFTGAYEAQGLRLQFDSMATTEKACLNGAMEQQFLSAIQGIDNYTVNESGLAFYKARTAAIVRFSAINR